MFCLVILLKSENCVLSDKEFFLFKELNWQVFDFGINPNWIFIYLVVCFCHKKRADAVWSVPLWWYYCCTSIGLWWSIGIAWCFCIDYGNVSHWMELDSSPRAILFLFSKENCRSAEQCTTYFCSNQLVRLTPRHPVLFLLKIIVRHLVSFKEVSKLLVLSAWLSQVPAIVGLLISPIRCHGKLCSYNVGIQ